MEATADKHFKTLLNLVSGVKLLNECALRCVTKILYFELFHNQNLVLCIVTKLLHVE